MATGDNSLNENIFGYFGYGFGVCGRQWLAKTLRVVDARDASLMAEHFPGEDTSQFKLCLIVSRLASPLEYRI